MTLQEAKLSHLREARKLYRKAKTFIKRGWCKYADALNESNFSVDPSNPVACKWCASGAMEAAAGLKIYNGDSISFANDVLNSLTGKKHCFNYIRFNDADKTTQAQVLRLFDRGINKVNRRITTLKNRKGTK